MQPFRYAVARSFAEAATMLGADAVVLGGGTDLVPLMQDGLAAPALLVDITRVPGGADVSVTRTEGARLGAAARLASLAAHPDLRRLYPALTAASAEVGTPQIRNVATLGGNLCQRPRCWYFRSGVGCWKSGGRGCPARDGMNEYLAVLGGGPCWAVHPSDPAVALLALDASVTVRRSDGTAEQRPLRELYVLPSVAVERETTLAVNEVVELIVLPPQYAGTRQSFRKVMQRQAWDFALASVAVVWPAHSARPRIVLGGVAPVPWLVEPEILPAAPARVRTRAFELWAANVADLALAGAKPLARNAYKVELTKALVRRALGARYSPASSATRASR